MSIRYRVAGIGGSIPFFLLLLTFGLLCGWEWLAATLFAATVHEMGHLLTLRLFGAGEGRLRFGLPGLEWQQTSRRMLSYGEELLSVLAGPGANILFALVIARISRELDWNGGYFFAGTHLVLGAFNLMPALPLDGGRALELLIAWWIDPICAGRVMGMVSLLTSGTLVLVGVWFFAATGSAFLLLGTMGLLSLTLREIGLVKAKRKR